MESNVLKANEGLVERVNALQAQVAKLENMLKLCLETIDQFGHFLPNIIEYNWLVKDLTTSYH